jgi:hypothetical protein
MLHRPAISLLVFLTAVGTTGASQSHDVLASATRFCSRPLAVFQNVPAGQLDNSLNSSRVQLITHWAHAMFDDLRVEEFAPR